MRLSLLALFVSGIMGYSSAQVIDCAVGSSVFTINSQGLSPNPPVVGQDATLWIDYTIPEGFNSNDGSCKYSVTFNGIPFTPTTETLCSQVACPLTPGTYNLTSTSQWPNVSGKVSNKIQWYDPNGNLLLCSQTTVRVANDLTNTTSSSTSTSSGSSSSSSSSGSSSSSTSSGSSSSSTSSGSSSSSSSSTSSGSSSSSSSSTSSGSSSSSSTSTSSSSTSSGSSSSSSSSSGSSSSSSSSSSSTSSGSSSSSSSSSSSTSSGSSSTSSTSSGSSSSSSSSEEDEMCMIPHKYLR